MKKAAIYSAILHVVAFLFLLFAMPFPERKPPVNEHPIIIEFEKIGPVSTAPERTPETNLEEKKAKKPVEPPKEESIQPKETPTEEKPEPVKESKKEEPAPLPEPKKKPEPVKEEKKPDPKKDPVKKPEKKDPKKEKKNDKAEVNLDPKKKPKPTVTKKDSKSIDDLVNNLVNDTLSDKSGKKGAPASQLGETITATDIDAVRSAIYKCWIVPTGAKNAKDIIVDIRMDIARDGTVTKAEIVNKEKMSDPYFETAAESAQRAVLDPACNPLPLPSEKYDKWKRLTLRFNPKDMY